MQRQLREIAIEGKDVELLADLAVVWEEHGQEVQPSEQ
jgi:hypothetical protein